MAYHTATYIKYKSVIITEQTNDVCSDAGDDAEGLLSFSMTKKTKKNLNLRRLLVERFHLYDPRKVVFIYSGMVVGVIYLR